MEKEVNLDLDWLTGERVVVHELLISPEGPAILIMIHDISPAPASHIVRLYSLREEGKDQFIVDHEIEGFAFPDNESAVEFADRLLKMSAIEILRIMSLNHREDEVGVLH